MQFQFIQPNSVFFILIVLLFASGCEKDEQTKLDNFIDTYIGTYLVVEDCDGNADAYSIQITRAYPPGSQVVINNLFDAGEEVKASVDSENGHLVIGSAWGNTTLQENERYRLTLEDGFGELSNDRLLINFRLKYRDFENHQSTSISCNLVGTK